MAMSGFSCWSSSRKSLYFFGWSPESWVTFAAAGFNWFSSTSHMATIFACRLHGHVTNVHAPPAGSDQGGAEFLRSLAQESRKATRGQTSSSARFAKVSAVHGKLLDPSRGITDRGSLTEPACATFQPSGRSAIFQFKPRHYM